MISVSERVATVLAAHVSDAFGVMGNGNVHLIDALTRTPVRFTAVRHETASVAAADAYHRTSRRIAVATTTYGPGYTNALTALAEAALAHTPLVLIVGDAPSAGPRLWDIDQIGAARALGVTTFVVDATTPGKITSNALTHALRYRTPVVLAIPYDVGTLVADPEELVAATGPKPLVPDPDDIEVAAQALVHARRPLILAGRGARDARKSLFAIADALGALTVSSAPARGTFAGRARDLGVSGGFASERTATLAHSADVVLVVGASLNQFTTSFGDFFSAQATVIQVDIAEAATNALVSIFVRGDANLTLAALQESVAVTAGNRLGDTWPGVSPADIAGAHNEREAGNAIAADGRLDPRSLTRRLDGILPADRLVVSDGGHFIGWANTYFELPAPDSIVLVGTAFQAIGLGIPSAVGAAVACPDRTIVVVTGDGGGLMGIADLDSLVRAAQRAIVIVFNDAAYSAEVHQYGSQGLDTAAMLINEVSFAAMGEAVGAQSVIVRTLDDLATLESWLANGAAGTFVVDCRSSGSVVAPYMREIMEKSGIRR